MNKRLNKHLKTTVPAGIAGLVIIVAGLEATNTTHLFHSKPAATPVVTPTTAPVSKPINSASVKPSPKKSSSSTQTTEAKATDTAGANSASTPASDWSTSASGLVTVKQPTGGSTFVSGDVVSGTAKVSQIWYRLVDDSAGQIGFDGPFNVFKGKFSFKISQLHPTGSTGRLDVFSYSGTREVNEVSIKLKF